jgi:hypothetical protein
MENEGGFATSVPNCIGLRGLLFGHKYTSKDAAGVRVTNYDACQRCDYHQ